MPFLCVFVPSYKVEVARLARPDLRVEAVLVVDTLERGHVIDLDARAFGLGARVGMTLLQAHACAREAVTVLTNPSMNAALWQGVLDALDAASPLVEDVEEGTAFLEMRGIEGTPEDWLRSARSALAVTANGKGETLPFALGLASSGFVARAAAGVAASNQAQSCIVETGTERRFLAPLALEVLHIDRETIERLHLLGVRTLAELAALPHGPFVRRFGAQAARWHAHARGVDERPLVPRMRSVRIEQTQYGEGSACAEDQLLFALRALVERVAADLSLLGKRCGFARLVLECEDGETHELSTALAHPTSQAATIFDLLRTRLEGVTLSSPVAGLRLGVERLEEGGAQQSLFAADDPDPELVGIALARLEAAFGMGSALRAQVTEGNRYETRFRYEPFSASELKRRGSLRKRSVFAERATLTLRLVEPEEIDVAVHAGFPTFVGAPPRAVLDVAGPWRVDEVWWDRALGAPCPQTVQRDEYDVLLEDAALWRIARDDGRWTLRGTYD